MTLQQALDTLYSVSLKAEIPKYIITGEDSINYINELSNAKSVIQSLIDSKKDKK